MKYRLLLFFISFLLVAPVAQAQKDNTTPPQEQKPGKPKPKSGFSSKDYIARKNAFITKNAQLSTTEASAVLPLLHKQKELQRANDEKIRNLRKQATTNPEDNKCLSILKEIRSLQQNNLKVEVEYQKLMLKEISPLKYLRLINADAAFDREMLHKMVGNPSHRGPQQGKGKPGAPKKQGNTPAKKE